VVTVAIPTLNADRGFERTLAAVRSQQTDAEVELLICDSGSRDGTVSMARRFGARVIEIPPSSFSHGGTRNLLMSEARGAHVAFLTQDAVPAGGGWLAELLRGFSLAPDVGLVFGPYRAAPEASVMVRRELTEWFDSFSTGEPRIDLLEPESREQPARHFLGHLGFFTDANGCVARAAWERVPFRPVAYAEDHLLAQDMLRAGFAKVYMPQAAVLHSHEYSPWGWLRRAFDEARAMREIYGWHPGVREVAHTLRGRVTGDWRWRRSVEHASPVHQASGLAVSAVHHGARAAGTLLAGAAERLPRPVVRRLSLEGRG
jgi:glycosyltransferase involved in cell wall biosynthesis